MAMMLRMVHGARISRPTDKHLQQQRWQKVQPDPNMIEEDQPLLQGHDGWSFVVHDILVRVNTHYKLLAQPPRL